MSDRTWRQRNLEYAVHLALTEGARVAVAAKSERRQKRDYTFLADHVQLQCIPEDWTLSKDRLVLVHNGGGWVRCCAPGPENEGMRATHVVQLGIQGVQTIFNPADFGL